jgi:mono/diheme cytochrome c family protein
MELRTIRLAVLVTGGLLAGCGDAPKQPVSAGAKLFSAQGCVACHGSHGEGSPMGPPLRAIKTNWAREDLVRYFADPHAFVAMQPRLQELGKRYPMPMPPIKASESDRLVLAEYVLAME